MTPEHAIKIIKKMHKGCPTEEQNEALENAYAALRRQIKTKVNEVHVDEYYCPACGAENNCNDHVVGDKFCPECGQALNLLN